MSKTELSLIFGGDISEPLMVGLKASPRPLKGRCYYQSICNVNTRVGAQQIYQDPWQEDPGFYLNKTEISACVD